MMKYPDLLKKLDGSMAMSATTKFSAKETFGAKQPAIKLWYLGDNFKKVMLGKVEKSVEATTLTAHTLTKDSLDAPIFDGLGGRAEVSLAHVWELLTKQANGESGFLLTNGSWNIFYVRGTDGNLWAVCAYWLAGFGWHVGAYSVGNPRGWCAGYQVVSR